VAALGSAAQDMEGTMIDISWHNLYARLKNAPAGKLYGIPRGGAIVAGMTGRAVNLPEQADWIVDDVKDSGATAARYQEKFNRPVWCLVDKEEENLLGQWVRFPWEESDPQADITDTVRRQLEFIGEDPTRAGLIDTPKRVIKALTELTEGYRQDPIEILGTTFDEPYDEMIVVEGINFFSLCEHHVLPFSGTATVGYIPSKRVVGLSKIARLVNCFSRRLQIQERLTRQIAQTLQEVLSPKGVGVILRGSHSCMTMRGIKSQGALVTSFLTGVMRDTPEARQEFLGFNK